MSFYKIYATKLGAFIYAYTYDQKKVQENYQLIKFDIILTIVMRRTFSSIILASKLEPPGVDARASGGASARIPEGVLSNATYFLLKKDAPI